jgi:hypothetical protein
MKKVFYVLFLTFEFITSYSQPDYQVAIGHTRTFTPKYHLLEGVVGITPRPSVGFYVDYNKRIKSSKKELRWGAQLKVSFLNGYYHLDKDLAYYPRQFSKTFISDFTSGELYVYAGKKLLLQSSRRINYYFSFDAGPTVIFFENMADVYEAANRTDNYMPFTTLFRYTHTQKTISVLPRASFKFQFNYKFTGHHQLGISPMMSFTFLKRDKVNFIAVPNDRIYTGVGYFKMNRNCFGLQLNYGL